eukprot:CAMPEP_0204843234 /NCGR_PEP_ID=MMETSP1346-20131115/47862_1 /ASSEMBLY_ACC=CAM_ASM_000771 /TAXON_ID=215587 /ORGANISM="Aplanochytrium stocchinoi, Strain GSBS06" /LENGTH=134 /DNA_ID=CAMNT_0051982347 /DNA_START=167 /DNA_END=572 /DNA_ORIENTATION=+
MHRFPLRALTGTTPFHLKKVYAVSRRMVHVEAKIAELGFKLPAVNSPKGNYALFTRTGNLLFTAGHLPQPADGPLITGKVGKDLDVDAGYEAAQYTALSLLATLKEELGDLDKIEKIVSRRMVHVEAKIAELGA